MATGRWKSMAGHRSREIEDAPENGGGKRQVEAEHPFHREPVRPGREMLGEPLAERGGHGLGPVGRKAGLLELSGETKRVDRGGGHVRIPSRGDTLP